MANQQKSQFHLIDSLDPALLLMQLHPFFCWRGHSLTMTMSRDRSEFRRVMVGHKIQMAEHNFL